MFISSQGFQEPSLKIHWTFPEPTCRLSTRYTRLCWEEGVVVNVDHLSWKDTPDHLGELVQHCLSGCMFSSPWVTEPSEVSQAYLSNPYGVLSDFPLCEDWKTSFSQAARPLRTPGCYSPHLHPGGTRGKKLLPRSSFFTTESRKQTDWFLLSSFERFSCLEWFICYTNTHQQWLIQKVFFHISA